MREKKGFANSSRVELYSGSVGVRDERDLMRDVEQGP